MCNKFKPLATGFHSHAEFSLDSGSTAESKLEYAASIDRIADNLTDHGIMSGLASHWMSGQKLKGKGVLPKDFILIHGIEAYVEDEDRPWKPERKGSKKLVPHYYHLTIHFKNMEAYFYFCKLTKVAEERALIKYGERKPLIKFAELEPIAQHIVLGSGCLLSPVQKNALVGRFDLAQQKYEYLRSLVGPDNFYVEVFPHIIDHNWRAPKYDKDTKKLITAGAFEPILEVRDWEPEIADMPAPEPTVDDPCISAIDIQKVPNQFVIELAEKYGDSVVISLDDHYGPPEHKAVQESRLGNGLERWKFFGSFHAKTSEEAAERLQKQLKVSDKKVEEWIDNGHKFVEHFDRYKFPTKEDQTLLPTTEMVYDVKYKDKTTKEIFWELVEKAGKMPAKDSPEYKLYKDRVDYELTILCDNDAGIDFMPYFFLLEDVCSYARANDILYTSRGSAGGSLALFLLGIVITNPIKHGLSFERFLNPGRIKGGSWPDVDLDWENRHLIIDYLKGKYGDSFALIANDSKMRLKSSILDATRAEHGFVSEEIAKMAQFIPIPIGTSDDRKWLYGETTDSGTVQGFIETDDPMAQELRKFAEKEPKIWNMVRLCMGITRQRGIHAGGVVITPGPVQNFMPVIKQSGTDDFATAYDMIGVEETGGVKYDMLGVKTLDALGIAMRSIKKEEGVALEWGEFPEDQAVYDNIIRPMLLEGVFQLNTNVAKPYVREIQPRNVTEMAALTALCRPGALDADSPNPKFSGTAAQYYVECANERMQPFFVHEDLEDILKETYGVPVYQEQLMKAGAVCAGYSEAEADIIIRKGIGKKKKDILEKFSRDLKERLPARGWDEGQIDQFINMVMASARYSFNKSHSVSYAIVAWNCAWIKHYYPAHYWKGMLTVFGSKEEKLSSMIAECGDRIRNIDVIKSHPTEWTIEDKFYLRMPLNIVKGCGGKGVEKLKTFIESSFEELEAIKVQEKLEKASKKG